MRVGISALIRKSSKSLFSLSALWGHSKTIATCKWGRGLLSRTRSCWPLPLDFQHPELWENKCLLFIPPSMWYFVMTAWAAKTPPLLHNTFFRELSSQIMWTQFAVDWYQLLTIIFLLLQYTFIFVFLPTYNTSVTSYLYMHLIKILFTFYALVRVLYYK